MVLLTYFDIKEGAAESWPRRNGFQEHGFGLLHCDSAQLVVGVDDVLQDEGGNVKNKLQRVGFNQCGVFSASFYRLPVVSRHDFDLVGRDQVSQ